ncbi:MAG TPA: sigma factor, partial [Candidatus Sulfotelmatobacter sp.]|nr:sigma factor [Candidatus Sulfotelmatobacter sp.]
MKPTQLEVFTECRPVLLALAKRILGRESEAEDLVQETYLRWQKTDPNVVKAPKAFLTTTLTRLCLNHLDLARVRLERDEDTIALDQL